MELKNELKKMNDLKSVDAEKFESHFHLINEKFTSPEDLQLIDEFLSTMLSESEKKIDSFIEESVKIQLSKVSQIISLSYIAQRYFNKSRNWLYQKINGSTVNGKPTKFTQEEIAILNFALKDISKEIGSTFIKL